MNPLVALKPESVAIVEAADRHAVLRALADMFARAWLLDPELVLEHLEEREKLGSTGFGRGVAIPHARFPGIARPVAAVLRLEQPVDFVAADRLPVELVFGLLSPENSGATHLHALASVSRTLRDEKLREALADAPDEAAIYALLMGATDRDAA